MIDGKENVLSKTLAKMNPRLFSHPLFRNYYLKLFYDVTFSTGVRGLYTPCHQVLRGNREKAVIDYDHMSFFRISYINYDQRTSRTLELQKEQDDVVFTMRYVFPNGGLFYHMLEKNILHDKQVYPIAYQYVGFDENVLDEKEYQKDWVYHADFFDKMKENGITPVDEHNKEENKRKRFVGAKDSRIFK